LRNKVDKHGGSQKWGMVVRRRYKKTAVTDVKAKIELLNAVAAADVDRSRQRTIIQSQNSSW